MYQLVFKGECAPGTDEQTARANAMALFKATLDQVDRMFSGNRVVIRNKLDEVQAAKYEAVLRKHGMIAHIEPMAGSSSAPAAPSSTTSSPASSPQSATPEPTPRSEPAPPTQSEPATQQAQPSNSGGVPVEPGDRLQVAGEKVDSILSGSSLKVDAAHDRLSEVREVETPMFEHLDDWTLAPPGSTLVEKTEEVPPVVPDISHLSLVDNDEDRK